MARNVISREEFYALMEEIDQQLIAEEIPPHARAFHADIRLLQRLGIDAPLLATVPNLDPNDFSPLALSAQVEAWYDDHLGERQLVDMGPGSIIVRIKGTYFEMRFPLAFGLHKFAPRERIVGLSDGMMRKLQQPEVDELSALYRTTFATLDSLWSSADAELVRTALTDLAASVRSFLKSHDFGHSKYATSQFIEKLMKARLCELGTAPPRRHQLAELAELLLGHGIQLPAADVDACECPSGARYAEPVSQTVAYEAHHASLRLAGLVYPSGP